MGLIAGAMEERGMRTVCLSTFDPIMEQVRPPRWLTVPFPLGYPVGPPHRPGVQRGILSEALRMLGEPGPGPISAKHTPDTEEA